MKKRILAFMLMLVLAASLMLVACSSEEKADSSQMTDEDRNNYISETMIKDGQVLTEESLLEQGFELSQESDTENMIQLLSNDNYSLYIDFKNTDIVLMDEMNGMAYFSNSTKIKGAGGSDLLQIEAYDNSNKKYEFTTSDDCIEDTTAFKVVRMDENTIRIIYTIGNDSDKELVPPVFSEDTFNSIIATLKSKAEASTDETEKQEFLYSIDDLNNLYKKLDPENLSLEDREKLEKTYPLVTVKTMYVVRSLTQKQKKLVRAAMEAADFTVSDLKQELSDVEYAGESRAVLFTIPLDLALTENGLKVSVDSEIILTPADQKLYSINVLPYFGAFTPSGVDPDAYIIIPDGSGSVMNASGNYTADAYSGRVYGTDETFAPSVQIEKAAQALSGFFAVNRSYEGGYLAVIDGGASMSYVKASPQGTSARAESAVAMAYYQLIYKERDFSSYDVETESDSSSSDSSAGTSTDTSTAEAIGSGIVTSKENPTTKFEINYLFSDGEYESEDINGHSYSWFANKYREYLIGLGKLPSEKLSQDAVTPIYIELLGAINKTESKAGIPVNSVTPLTSYSQAKDIVQALYDAGIPGNALKLRYTYWANGGYENTAYTEFDLIKEMGKKSELIELRDLLKNNSSGFYPSADLLYIHKDTSSDGLNYSEATARNLSSSIARINDRNPATGALETSAVKERTLLSPGVIVDMATSLRESYEDIFGTEMNTLSLSGMGTALNSSYKSSDVYMRDEAKAEQQKALEVFDGYKLMVDTGNDYVWKYASDIINLPMGSSELLSTSGSIPFIQIVLHGYLNYSGSAFNVDADYTSSILQAVETGAGLYFKWMGAENDIFKYTDFADFYSLKYTDTIDDAISAYATVSEFCDLVQGQTITNHAKAEAYIQSPYIGDIESETVRDETDNVFMTTFENGIQVVVNYNSYNVELGDLDAGRYVVSANSYVYRMDESSDWIVPAAYTEKGGN